MAIAAVFVSKRLQKAAVAITCLMMAQMLISVSSCTPEHVPMAARVAISR